jgi:hypothetical protein
MRLKEKIKGPVFLEHSLRQGKGLKPVLNKAPFRCEQPIYYCAVLLSLCLWEMTFHFYKCAVPSSEEKLVIMLYK